MRSFASITGLTAASALIAVSYPLHGHRGKGANAARIGLSRRLAPVVARRPGEPGLHLQS